MKRLTAKTVALFLMVTMLTACNTVQETTVDTTSESTTAEMTEASVSDNEITESYFEATILEVYENSILVEPFEGYWVSSSADRITVPYSGEIELQIGDIVGITFSGELAESYPAQIMGETIVELIERTQDDEGDVEESDTEETQGTSVVSNIQLYSAVLEHTYDYIIDYENYEFDDSNIMYAYSDDGLRECFWDCSDDVSVRLNMCGFSFIDLNHDGIDELLIDNGIFITGIYTLVSGEPVLVEYGYTRSSLRLFNNGYIFHRGSSGAGYNMFEVMVMESDLSLTVLDLYYTEDGPSLDDSSGIIYFHSNDCTWDNVTVITAEDYHSSEERYISDLAPLNSTSFALLYSEL